MDEKLKQLYRTASFYDEDKMHNLVKARVQRKLRRKPVFVFGLAAAACTAALLFAVLLNGTKKPQQQFVSNINTYSKYNYPYYYTLERDGNESKYNK